MQNFTPRQTKRRAGPKKPARRCFYTVSGTVFLVGGQAECCTAAQGQRKQQRDVHAVAGLGDGHRGLRRGRNDRGRGGRGFGGGLCRGRRGSRCGRGGFCGGRGGRGLDDQRSEGGLDVLCHGIHIGLLGDVLAAVHSVDGGIHSGEIRVVVAVQCARLVNRGIDRGVVGGFVGEGQSLGVGSGVSGDGDIRAERLAVVRNDRDRISSGLQVDGTVREGLAVGSDNNIGQFGRGTP